jgi:transposase
MARAYSSDLRSRIVNTYEQGETSIRKVAKQFQVSKNFVVELLKLWKSTRSVSPRPHGGGNPSKFAASHIAILEEIVEQYNDATLEELAKLLEEKCGLSVSPSTICRQLQKLNLTLKKKLSITQFKNLKRFK